MNNRHFASNCNYVITSDEATPLLYGGFTFNDFKLRGTRTVFVQVRKLGVYQVYLTTFTFYLS